MEEEKSLLQQTNEAAERLEKANAEAKAILQRQAEERINGRAIAGTPTPVPVEETPQDYAKRVMAGKA